MNIELDGAPRRPANAHSRALAVALFENERAVQPFKTASAPWAEIIKLHRLRTVRPNKSGPMLGGYKLSGRRSNPNVPFRSLIQLDIDSSGSKDRKTGRLLEVTKSAPPLEHVRGSIEPYEWVAHSTHWHEPDREAIKYRITLLPDRDIQPDEYEAVLEGLNERMGGVLDRGAWSWSQAFYLASCPSAATADAFFEHNAGTPLPIDEFVARGREIIQLRKALGSQSPPQSNVVGGRLSEIEQNIDDVRRLLAAIPPDLPRDRWRNAVWSIASLGWNCGETLTRDWSMRAPELFDPSDFAKVWSSFDPHRQGGIGIGTLMSLAREHGFAAANTSRTFDGKGSDKWNGEQFANMWRGKLLHIFETGEWLRFEESSGWLHADPLEEDRAAKQVLDELKCRAADILRSPSDEAVPQRQLRHIEYTSKASNLRAMVELAKSEPRMTMRLSHFDADPMLLGVRNGVIDLRQGQLLLPSADVLVSRRCRVAYDTAAPCPTFERFMREVQPDDNIRLFLQRWVGYCLSGEVKEQVFTFYFGSGANGKSVFVEIIAWLLGDYARKIPTEMLMHHQRNPQGPSPDIVALKGVRLACANETEEGRRFAEARVKELTGGDTLSGRVPYGKADISFSPTHKLIIAGNHKPEISDMSNGMWRRVLLVGFGETFSGNRCDPALLEKLKHEGSGILNWALAGFQDWRKSGLRVPHAVSRSTAEYREEQDIIGEWVAENCVTGAGRSCRKSDLYADYSDWAKRNGHFPLAQGRLTKRLNERGFRLRSDKRTVDGLSLVAPALLGRSL